MSGPNGQRVGLGRSSGLWPFLAVVLVAFALRSVGAWQLTRHLSSSGRRFAFADSELYWLLGERLAAGGPYTDGKRWILRTPGYPAFLAVCIKVFGSSAGAARQVQAALGALSCLLIGLLAGLLFDRRTARLAAWFAACDPFAVLLSVVILSEAVFVPLLALHLVLLALLGRWLDARPGPSPFRAALDAGDWWSAAPRRRLVPPEERSGVEQSCDRNSGRARKLLLLGLLIGLVGAGAALVRPSWLLATPLFAVAAVAFARRAGSIGKLQLAVAAAVLLGLVAGMSPWWVRNWSLTGRFVPTTLWVGASLYDGLNPRADGSSNMEFMDRPRAWRLDPRLKKMGELEQDQYLRRKAWQFAFRRPDKVFDLAIVKLRRFWNPVPNTALFGGAALWWLSLARCVPLFALALVGTWRLRGWPWHLCLLIGPVLYLCLIHTLFPSSIRYRESAMLPVMVLVAWTVLVELERRRLSILARRGS
jgi:4-amino-4-deoxy-L-arabinose transferase-like glycosyltransferase